MLDQFGVDAALPNHYQNQTQENCDICNLESCTRSKLLIAPQVAFRYFTQRASKGIHVSLSKPKTLTWFLHNQIISIYICCILYILNWFFVRSCFGQWHPSWHFTTIHIYSLFRHAWNRQNSMIYLLFIRLPWLWCYSMSWTCSHGRPSPGYGSYVPDSTPCLSGAAGSGVFSGMGPKTKQIDTNSKNSRYGEAV